jgi:TPR repeat protein
VAGPGPHPGRRALARALCLLLGAALLCLPLYATAAPQASGTGKIPSPSHLDDKARAQQKARQKPIDVAAARTAKKPQAQQPKSSGSSMEEATRAYTRGDFATAHRIWEQHAKQGDAQAMSNLGVLYDLGQGVEQDSGRAVHWFESAAKAGHPSGMSNYGRMLEQGRGVEADPKAAAEWFDKAARQGVPEAQYNLGLLYEHGRGVAQSDEAAAAWYSRAATQQQTNAMARLGHMYRLGRGVPRDEERATLLLYGAAMNGIPTAIAELEEMAGSAMGSPAGQMLGQRLDNVDRPTMRKVLREAGAIPINEENDRICDIYAPNKFTPGAKELSACYGRGDSAPLGFVKIDYPVRDRQIAEKLKEMIEERFGPPSASEGEDSQLWNLGSVVVASRYVPTHGQMSLMYMMPRVYFKTRRP